MGFRRDIYRRKSIQGLGIQNFFFWPFIFIYFSLGEFLEIISEEYRVFCSVDIAQGYMSNPDLEKAMKAFNRRCSNISRMYR